MIYGFFGDLGSGKTLSMTKYVYWHYLTGYDVYSNYKLSFKHKIINADFVQKVVKEDLNFSGKTIFCLDEIDMYMDSRRSAKEKNLLISYFIKQIRKKNIKLFYTTQAEHLIDKRLRGLTRTHVQCKSTDLYLYKKYSEEPLFIKVIYNEIFVNRKIVGKKRYVGNPYFDKYDTKQLIVAE